MVLADTKEFAAAWLERFGHFENPDMQNAMDARAAVVDPASRTPDLESSGIKEAVRSIQNLDANYDRLWRERHGCASPPPADGVFDDVTLALMNLERCGCKDYGEEAATGQGSWQFCNVDDPDHPNVHTTRAYIDWSGASSHQKAAKEWVELACQTMFAYVGWRIYWNPTGPDPQNEEHFSRFIFIPGGVIGRHMVGPGRSTCNWRGTGTLDNSYFPNRYNLAVVVAHELFGHGAGEGHYKGGFLNPSIYPIPADANGFPTLEGDPAQRRYNTLFGGEPVPIAGGDPAPSGIQQTGEIECIAEDRDGNRIDLQGGRIVCRGITSVTHGDASQGFIWVPHPTKPDHYIPEPQTPR